MARNLPPNGIGEPYDYDKAEISSTARAMEDGIDLEKYIIGTYYVRLGSREDGESMGMFAAIEQSTGTWIRVPAETEEVRKNHVAKVCGVYEVPQYESWLPDKKDVPERDYIFRIAFPVINMNQVRDVPMLLSTIVGNISMAGKLKLIDVQFPKDYLKDFKGPKFGIEGLRKYLGVNDRPLLNNMIKPCTGHTAAVGADLAYRAAVGGVDCVKDDELIADPSFNTLEDRVTAYMDALDRADEEKGEKTLYACNVTAKVDRIFDLADKVIGAGGNCIMVNYLTVGLSVMQKLAEDPSIKVPIMAHMDFAGVWYCDPFSGVSSYLTLGKFPRICGADIVVTPAPYGKAPYNPGNFKLTMKNQVYPLQHILPTMPMISGGISPHMVESAIRDAGKDIMIGSGGGIHAHPEGPIAGGKAFRQAIDAAMAGIPAKKYAKENNCHELGVAMGLWEGKTKFQSI
ncbi:MAG: RuBisCO large subunit C-terminal-like domain-containing protein [Promethearchaeota archaeon]